MRSSSVFCVGWRNTEGTSVIDRCTVLVIFHSTWYDNSIASTKIEILEENEMDKKSTHPFAPEIPEGATKLIIGTMPPYRFCNTDEALYDDDVNFYYGSRDNYFWELVSDASGKRLTYANTQEAIDERKKLLADLHMGMVDMIVSCVHKDGKADDESLCDIEERDNLKAMISAY